MSSYVHFAGVCLAGGEHDLRNKQIFKATIDRILDEKQGLYGENLITLSKVSKRYRIDAGEYPCSAR